MALVKDAFGKERVPVRSNPAPAKPAATTPAYKPASSNTINYEQRAEQRAARASSSGVSAGSSYAGGNSYAGGGNSGASANDVYTPPMNNAYTPPSSNAINYEQQNEQIALMNERFKQQQAEAAENLRVRLQQERENQAAEAARERKQSELTKNQVSAAELYKNILQKQQMEQLNAGLDTLKANMAKSAANKGAAYPGIPMQWPRLSTLLEAKKERSQEFTPYQQLQGIADIRAKMEEQDTPFRSEADRKRYLKFLDEKEVELLTLMRNETAHSNWPQNGAMVYIGLADTTYPRPVFEYSAFEAFISFGYASELGVNMDAPYVKELLQRAQWELDTRDSSQPMKQAEMQSLLNGIQSQIEKDMENDPATTAFRVSLPGTKGGAVVNAALDWLGTPYVFGKKDPEKGGIDCSGLVRYCVSQVAPDITVRNAPLASNKSAYQAQKCKDAGWTIWEQGDGVPNLSELQAGDIVFWYNTEKGSVGHTGIYAGNDCIVEASSIKGEVSLLPFSNRLFYDSLLLDSIVRPPY